MLTSAWYSHFCCSTTEVIDWIWLQAIESYMIASYRKLSAIFTMLPRSRCNLFCSPPPRGRISSLRTLLFFQLLQCHSKLVLQADDGLACQRQHRFLFHTMHTQKVSHMMPLLTSLPTSKTKEMKENQIEHLFASSGALCIGLMRKLFQLLVAIFPVLLLRRRQGFPNVHVFIPHFHLLRCKQTHGTKRTFTLPRWSFWFFDYVLTLIRITCSDFVFRLIR